MCINYNIKRHTAVKSKDLYTIVFACLFLGSENKVGDNYLSRSKYGSAVLYLRCFCDLVYSILKISGKATPSEMSFFVAFCLYSYSLIRLTESD